MKYGNGKIVVVGSANVDLIVRSERLPRPGETVTGRDLVTAGGGKGANQAIAARRLEANVEFVARVGDDGFGQYVLSSLQAEGLDRTHVTVDPSAPTGVALILVDHTGQNMISLSPGANARLTPADVRGAEAAFVDASVLVTQLEVPLETVKCALELGRVHHLINILNPAPALPVPADILALVDWLTPNEVEASTLAGMPVDDLATGIDAGRLLAARGLPNVVVTLGSRGAVYVSAAGVLVVDARDIVAVDATAAGDAFTAGLAVGLAWRQPPAEALAFASACGALTTTRSGAQPALPRRTDVDEFLARRTTTPGLH